MKRLAIAAALIGLVAIVGTGADVLFPGHDLTTYVSGIPDPSNLAIDLANGTIYYAEYGSQPGALYRVSPDRSLTLLTPTFAYDVGDWYPYVATEIAFVDGHVYSALCDEALVEVDVATGAAVERFDFGIFGWEAFDTETGIAAAGDLLYIVDGYGWSDSLYTYDLATDTPGMLVPLGLPELTLGAEYDPISDRLFLSAQAPAGTTATAYYEVDVVAETLDLVAIVPWAVVYGMCESCSHFAVDPTGEFLFVRNGDRVQRVTIADGTVVDFVTGLTVEGYYDLLFGPSSSGHGTSLYVSDEDSILEIAGFAGEARRVVRYALLPAALAGFLQRGFVLPPGEEAPRIGELALSAVYEIGEVIRGACRLCDDTGAPIDARYLTLTLYGVTVGEAFDVRVPLETKVVRCDPETGSFCFEFETDDLVPGLYDVRIGYPHGAVAWLRVQLVAPPTD